jgi:myo-inositol-1(or 4)-monophosphatase
MEKNSHQDIEELASFAMDTLVTLGKEALEFYGKGRDTVKFDEDLVTAAELHLVNSFEKLLKARFPTHQLFEKSHLADDYAHDGKRYLWIFDPVDGVDNFQSGIPVWGISVALLENFWPVFGAFHMPSTGDLFHARADGKAYRGNVQIAIPPRNSVDDESILLTYSRFHRNYTTAFPGKIRDLGCTSAHICYVATGRADAALIANESYQDLAAARIIIEAAGGKICMLDGCTFFLNEYLDGRRIDEHLLVVAPDNFDSIRQCLTTQPE